MHVTIDKCLLHCFVVHDFRRMFYFWKAFSCKRNGGCEYQPTCLQWKECNDDGTSLCTAIHSSKGFIIKSWATLGMDLTCVRKRSTVAVYQNSPCFVWVPCETVCGAFDMNFILHCRSLITYDQRVFQPRWKSQTSFISWHVIYHRGPCSWGQDENRVLQLWQTRDGQKAEKTLPTVCQSSQECGTRQYYSAI